MIAKDDGEGFKKPIIEAMKKHLTFKQIMKAATLAQRVSSNHIYNYFGKEFDLINNFPSPRGYLNLMVSNINKDDSEERKNEFIDSIASIYLSEELYIKFENKIKERREFIADYILVINIFNIYDKKLDKPHGLHFDIHQLSDFDKLIGPYSPGTFNHSHEMMKDSEEIIENLSSLLKDVEWTNNNYEDDDGSFEYTRTELKSGEYIVVQCYDWNKKIEKEKEWTDHLRVSIESKEYYYWINFVAVPN